MHPHATIADFMNKYDEFIEPALKKGTLESFHKAVILDVVYRAQMLGPMVGIGTDMKDGVYGHWAMTIQQLRGLLDRDLRKGEFDTRGAFEMTADSIQRYASELEIKLQDDPHYEKIRQRTERKKVSV